MPRCNPLKDKDIVSYRSSCPPCRRFRSSGADFHAAHHVVRRVGGLEARPPRRRRPQAVVRRVGGLEDYGASCPDQPKVVRRVGGLEGVGGYHM